MTRRQVSHCACLLPFTILSAAVSPALVGDPQIKTDHPYYQGELAYSTLNRLVNSALATPGRPSTGDPVRDKVLKLWYWRIEHMFHRSSPEIYAIPGVTPDPKNNNPLMIEYDSLSLQFSYGHALCGTNHGTLRPILEAAGFGSRRRALVGDTGHEIRYNGRWALFNTDSVSLISRSDSPSADFAGVDEIIANRSLLSLNPLKLPQYTFGSVSDKGAGPHSADWYFYNDKGFNLSATKSWRMYGEGFQARPIVYTLKAGEKFTRFGDRDGLPAYLGEPGGYRFWGFQGSGGVFRDWSHVGLAPAKPTPPTSNAKGNSRYGNGIFEWNPDLARGDFREGAAAIGGKITAATDSPRLRTTGGTDTITFLFYSPYVVVAKPADGADPARAGATGGAWIVADAVGKVPVEISNNDGASWASAGTLQGGGAKIDFTDRVKGRYQYLVRLTLSGTSGLDRLSLNTAVQVAEGVWPWLSAGGCTVTYSAGRAGGVQVIPDYTNQQTADHFKVDDSGNVRFTPLSASNSWAYTSTNNKPCTVTYRVKTPGGAKLTKIHGAADGRVRVPPSNAHMRLHVSTDGGGTFTQFAEYVPPSDNELSHGWVYGSADVSAAGVDEALVRVEFYNGGYTAGLRFARLYGEYATPAPSGLQITHTWDDDGGASKTHVETLPPGTTSATYTVPTGTSPVHRSVAFSAVSDPATPVARFAVSAGTPEAGKALGFDGSGSSDDQGVVRYEWDFGDGQTATGPVTSHVFSGAGRYAVTLTVIDGGNRSDTTQQWIQVTDPGSGGPGGDVTPPAFPALRLQIAGAVDDLSVATLDVNGTAAPLVGGRFQSQAVLLPAGATTAIVLTASDAANTAKRVLRVDVP